MNTNVDTSLEHFLSIVESIEEPCEHNQHESFPRYHSGKGEWYLTSRLCTNCGRESTTKLVCEKFAQYIFSGGRVRCAGCGIFKGYGVPAYDGIKRKG